MGNELLQSWQMKSELDETKYTDVKTHAEFKRRNRRPPPPFSKMADAAMLKIDYKL